MSYTDKELIELAALAAGLRLDVWGWDDIGLREYRVCGVPHCGFVGPVWNPLHDDGDALRLAVKLRIQLTPGAFRNNEFAAYACGGIVAREYSAPTIKDEFAATRRAIVRAAAEIGRGM